MVLDALKFQQHTKRVQSLFQYFRNLYQWD